MQTLLITFVLAQPPVVPLGPPDVPTGPPVVPMTVVVPKVRAWPSGDYVLFVKAEERPVGDLTTFRFDGAYDRPGVYWINKSGQWRLSDEMDPLEAIKQHEEVRRSAVPFVKSRERLLPLRRGELQPLTADADRNDPRFVDLLSGMVPYETASQTQTTFRRVVGFIQPSPRLALPNKWNVPGHLDGISGWSSRLYKNASAQVFLVRQDPYDSVSAVTWGRSYPNGASFVDVLRGPTGKVFEVRVAQKSDGVWERFVAFSDPSARPIGYHRPASKDCRVCHNEAGTSAYGGAAIPGADSVISDPFDLLEAGRVVQGGNGLQL